MKRIISTIIAISSFLILVPETGSATNQIQPENIVHVSGEATVTTNETVTHETTEEHASAGGHEANAGPHIPDAK